jgi:Domain of unknown function (DUF3943)
MHSAGAADVRKAEMPGRPRRRHPGGIVLALLFACTANPCLAGDNAANSAWQLLPRFRTDCCLPTSLGVLADADPEYDAALLDLSGDDRDRAGLRRDTWYFAGYQFAAVAILYLMPESVTGWSTQEKHDYSMSKWWHNVTHPHIDGDKFYINYIVHPYWGGAYFVRARERGYDNMESFWYSAMLSAMFEFGAEALAEPVSIQDLIATPVLGSFAGMWFMDLRAGVEARTDVRGHRTAGDTVILALTDPLGSINNQVDKLFGRDVDVRVRPYTALSPAATDPFARPFRDNYENVIGLQFELDF